MSAYKRIVNRLLRQFEIQTIPTEGRGVYLTFDDGPESGITEYVLEELDKYGFKATFFCRGDNAEKNPELLSMLRERGHSIGNHTYNHLHAYESPAKEYIKDVKRADAVLHTILFRPPHGSLTLNTWWKLRNRKIVFWSLNSEDSALENFDYDRAIENLKSKTQNGDVVLFHFCHRHEKETRRLLPVYLKWLNEEGYLAKGII